MCCLFGFIDYKKTLNKGRKNTLVHVLAQECEARGTHATGIAYHSAGELKIVKRAVPGRKLRAKVPDHVTVLMGHTRMTTQGSEKLNYNNHPFPGKTRGKAFALAHNGMLHNDLFLHETEALPKTQIETDSYVAVQLLEKENAVHHESLKKMAELVDGSFVFTVLDEENSIYFVKGENPLCIYHFKKLGLYVYASTETILRKALRQLKFIHGKPIAIATELGDILRIRWDGTYDLSHFDNPYLSGLAFPSSPAYRWTPPSRKGGLQFVDEPWDGDEYYQELRQFATVQGYQREDVDEWVEEGYAFEEIEEFLYYGQYL